MPMDDRGASIDRSTYALWLEDCDEKGRLVESLFIEAAYKLEPILLKYRQDELGCKSLAATLVQKSVNSASRASKAKPVENAAAYLWRTFTRKVDKYLMRASREFSLSENFIEDLKQQNRNSSDEVNLSDNRILLRQLKDQLDDWTRQVLNMRIAGYSWDEIGADFSELPNTVTVRYSRGMNRALECLFDRSADRGK